ncbi:MAG: DUF5320 domain-containing protein [Thermodesulfobacteriota bacterium]
MCQPTRTPHFARVEPNTCGCGCGQGFRRFFSAKEEEECLERYKEQLTKEMAGVDERLKELKGM